MKSRSEVDLLGELEINQDSYYGIHTQRAINNFNISNSKIGDYPLFIKGLVITKKACALANKEIGAIPDDKADMVIDACDEILKNLDKYSAYFPTDVFQGGAGTSVNMNTNEVIANVALELHGHAKGDYDILNPNDHVNKSQSTNDAYPTGFRVAIYLYINSLLKHLEQLINQLDKKSDEFSKVLKMGRTQLQDAVPMSLGDEFSAWGTNLREEIKSLKMCRDLVLEVNLGATAIGTGLNAPKGYSEKSIDYLKELTKVNFVKAENLIEATSDCGAYVMISGALKRTAVKLSKICNDLRLLSSGPRCGLNEINLPEMQAGSSIMPAKVNPVIPEVVNQVCFKVIGNDVTISFAAEAGQLQLNVMEPVIAQSLFESIDLLSNACSTLTNKCIIGITANAEHTKSMVLNSIGLITFLNPYIGHHMGDVLGKEAVTTGKSIKELVLEKELLSEEELDEILSFENLMRPKYRAQLFKKQ
ncbi:aspartate ammonia-lyase [Flavobacteriaceae bacterium S0825]|uniref:aspartate ammonia-lyase n=1 Tax=Gaetbulibacter sp. S0825 TaxID=2720084 RepID=UPI0014320682|nr:aspartate ammonia-lyase [Gaetbulibacter sp. S0825]MCK0109767.1 aspartate ammonia-lyase [Flavobacteriaceae bacterium S0825]NIX65399.1 aspartate ammonia-lyase [Gaetbulibacter sp. S0825]